MDTISLPLAKQDFVTRFVGHKMILARNSSPAVEIQKIDQIVFGETTYDGEGDRKGSYSLSDGQLVLNDEWGKPAFIFRGAETRNGSTYIVGEPYMEAAISGFVRYLLYEYKPLTDFRICVSTHLDYTAETMPKFTRSLIRAGVPKENVVVVVGGTKEECVTTIDGCKTVLIKSNFDGLTGLTALDANYNGYWLLLHDTCELMDDFKERMSKLDVGLNLDLFMVADEIGLYSAAFVKRLMAQGVISPGGRTPMTQILNRCLLWAESSSRSRHLATKDIYGTGIQREVLYFDEIGVKKYRRVKGAPAKP